MEHTFFLCLLLFLSAFVTVSCGDGTGIIAARKSQSDDKWQYFCIRFNPQFQDLPADIGQVTQRPLTDLTSTKGCNQTDYKGLNVNGTVVAVARGDCNFVDKADIAQARGAVAVLVTSDQLVLPGAANETVDYNRINITVATIQTDNFKAIQDIGSSIKVKLYAPEVTHPFDPNIVVIFLIAVSCIVIGGYWSGVSQNTKLEKKKSSKKKKKKKKESQQSDSEDETEEDDTVNVSLPAILIFFVLVCTFLLLLYFFYDYLVYVVLGLFVIAGAVGLYSCTQPILARVVPVKCRIPQNRVPCFKDRPDIKNIILGLVCLGLGIFWLVERHAPFAWVLQDILGYTFCLNMLKTVHIPNLKILSVLLVLLFIYDIFFVFITPLFTKTGHSVMVDVATGGSSKTGEQLPMLFQVPRLSGDPVNICLPMSMLGFGDIIVPGLLVAYNHAFDLKVQSSRIYFIATSIAYAVGLVITFVALFLMESGQPALLYLVPCTLITTFVIGLKRKEVKLLWRGELKCSKKDDDIRDPSHTSADPEKVSTNDGVNAEVSSVSSTESESRGLIRK